MTRNILLYSGTALSAHIYILLYSVSDMKTLAVSTESHHSSWLSYSVIYYLIEVYQYSLLELSPTG